MSHLKAKLLALTFLLLGAWYAPAQAQPRYAQDGLTVLAAGGYSGVEEPFLLVARDARTYQALRAIISNLPARQADYFQRQAVVAAFTGARRTGGYSVDIKRRKDTLVVLENRPKPGGIVTQSLTTPFVVVEFAVERDQALSLAFDGAWQNALRTYRVSQGNFQFSGGFAGITEKFRLAGRLQTLTHEGLVTFVSDLQSVGGKQPRRLNNVATGFVSNQGKVEITYLHANTLVEMPGNLLTATGQFDRQRRRLTLNFEPLPVGVADGFEGKGQLTAVAGR